MVAWVREGGRLKQELGETGLLLTLPTSWGVCKGLWAHSLPLLRAHRVVILRLLRRALTMSPIAEVIAYTLPPTHFPPTLATVLSSGVIEAPPQVLAGASDSCRTKPRLLSEAYRPLEDVPLPGSPAH